MNLGEETHCESKMSWAKKKNIMSSARARTPTARYAGESSNYEAAVPIIIHIGIMNYCLHMTGAGKVVTFDT